MLSRLLEEVKLPGIKLTPKDNYPCLYYIINQLLRPEIKKFLFDDYMGITEITTLLFAQNTVVYSIYHKGLPEPVGVVFFTGTIPYRDCYLFSCVFSSEDRRKGIINDIIPKVRQDMKERFAVHSCTANIIGNNSASSYILEKMGFKKIGVKKDYIMINGKYRDLSEYYILGEEA